MPNMTYRENSFLFKQLNQPITLSLVTELSLGDNQTTSINKSFILLKESNKRDEQTTFFGTSDLCNKFSLST